MQLIFALVSETFGESLWTLRKEVRTQLVRVINNDFATECAFCVPCVVRLLCVN